MQDMPIDWERLSAETPRSLRVGEEARELVTRNATMAPAEAAAQRRSGWRPFRHGTFQPHLILVRHSDTRLPPDVTHLAGEPG